MIKKILFHLSIILIAIVLTVVFTWPFINFLGTYYYDRGDYQVSGATLSYNAYSIGTGKIFNADEYFNGFQYYPQPYTLLYSDLRLFPSLFFLLINSLTKNFILSVNLVSFLTFVLSFISSFYVIRYFTKNFMASIIGAIIFTFNPLTFSRFPEHFELLNKYFLPLLFLFAYQFLEKPSIKKGFLFAFIFVCNAFSSAYFQIFSIIILPIFALPFFWINFLKKNKTYFFKLIFYSFTFLIFLPILLYLNNAYLNFSKYESSIRSLEDNSYFSARLIDFISANKQNLLYGGFTNSLDLYRAPKDNQGNFNYLEHTLFLNIIPMILFIIFLLYFHKDKSNRIFILPFTLILLTTFILSFGPYWQGWNSQNSGFKLPFYYLYQYLPILKGIRAPTRILFFFYVPFSLFTSLAFLYLEQRIKNKKIIISIFVIIVTGLFIENFHFQNPTVSYIEKSEIIPKINNTQAEKDLSFLKDKKTIHFPVLINEIGLSSLYLNWAAITHEKIANGNSGFLPSEQYSFLQDIKDSLDEDNLKKLKILDFDYIVYHKNLLRNNINNEILNKFESEIVYNQNNVIILDIKKLSINVKFCHSINDLKIQNVEMTIANGIQKIQAVIIENKNDCFVPNIYQNKYLQKYFISSNLFGGEIKRKFYLKLPVLISPYQETILSELNNNLRIE